MLYAWKDGLTVVNEENMNKFLALQEFTLIYEGNQIDASTGEGITENSLADYTYAAEFTLTGTEISRIELHLDKDGQGADLEVKVSNGAIFKDVVVPKEFIPDGPAWVSVPIGLTGLNPADGGALVIYKAGDAANKIDWIGESAPDPAHPAYRIPGLVENNALHFKVFSGASGDLKHSIYGDGFTTVEYDGEIVSKVYRYLPPADGPDGGIRDIITYTFDSGYLTGGVVE